MLYSSAGRWFSQPEAFGQTGRLIPYSVCVCRINYLTSLFRERESNGLLTFCCCCCSTVPGPHLSRCSYPSVCVLTVCHSRHEIAVAKALGQRYALRCALRESSWVLGDCLVLLTVGDAGCREPVFIFLAVILLLTVHFL